MYMYVCMYVCMYDENGIVMYTNVKGTCKACTAFVFVH